MNSKLLRSYKKILREVSATPASDAIDKILFFRNKNRDPVAVEDAIKALQLSHDAHDFFRSYQKLVIPLSNLERKAIMLYICNKDRMLWRIIIAWMGDYSVTPGLVDMFNNWQEYHKKVIPILTKGPNGLDLTFENDDVPFGAEEPTWTGPAEKNMHNLFVGSALPSGTMTPEKYHKIIKIFNTASNINDLHNASLIVWQDLRLGAYSTFTVFLIDDNPLLHKFILSTISKGIASQEARDAYKAWDNERQKVIDALNTGKHGLDLTYENNSDSNFDTLRKTNSYEEFSTALNHLAKTTLDWLEFLNKAGETDAKMTGIINSWWYGDTDAAKVKFQQWYDYRTKVAPILKKDGLDLTYEKA